MFRKFKSGWLSVLLVAFVLAATGVGTALAQSPDDDIIYGAYQKNNGMLRIISDPNEVRPSEIYIEWNAKGPTGPQGPQGEQGPIAGTNGQFVYNNNGSAAGAEVYYEKSTGNVGIGTTSPAAVLDVSGEEQCQIN